MNTIGRILRNIIYLFLSLIVTQIFSFLTMVYLARTLGPGEYGKLNFAFTIVTFFSLLTLSGIPMLGMRQIAKSKDTTEIKIHISKIMVSRFLLALISFLFLFLFTVFLNRPLQMKYLIILFGFNIFFSSLSVDWIFRGIERMEFSELPGVLCAIIYMNLIFLFIKGSPNILLIPCIGLLVNVFILILSFLILFKLLGRIRFNFNLNSLKEILVTALPLSLLVIFYQMGVNIEKLALGFMRNNEELGYYVAAYKFILILHMAIFPYYTAIFPVLSKYYHHSLDSFKKLTSQTANIMFILSVPLACGGFVLSEPIINLVYGAKFALSKDILQILIWAIIFIYGNSILSQGLLAAEREKRLVLIYVIKLLFIATFSLVFIPKLGMKAAAWAIVLGELIGLLITYREFKKIIIFPIGKFILKPLISSFFMIAFLKIYFGRNLILLISMGASIYFLSLILLKGFPWEETELIWNAILSDKNKSNIKYNAL